jgi:hypothetical protein
MMDRALEMTFCALVGSKFAAVVAGGQNTSWLVDYCRALVKAHAELSDAERKAVTDALTACQAEADKRGVLVHSIMSADGPESVVAIKGAKRTHRLLPPI